MDYKVLHQEKMRKFFNEMSGQKITDPEFQNVIDMFIDTGRYIYEEMDCNPHIQEGCSTEIDIGRDTYEVWVHYHTFHDSDGAKTLIDLDYSHFEET